MKKKNTDLMITLITVVIAIVAIVVVRETTRPKTIKTLSTPISATEVTEKIAANEEFIFFIGTETCSACMAYKPVVNEFITTTGQVVYYLDINKSFGANDNEARDAFFKDVLKTDTATPQTFYVSNGKIQESFTGNVNLFTLQRFVERNATK